MQGRIATTTTDGADQPTLSPEAQERLSACYRLLLSIAGEVTTKQQQAQEPYDTCER